MKVMVVKRVVKASMTVAVLAAALAGTARGADVTVNADKTADFSRCATWAWVEGTSAKDPLVHKSIVAAIERALAEKGWTTGGEAPGCHVTYHAALHEERGLSVFTPGRFRGGFGSVEVTSVLNGTLVVDVADARGELIWRGVAKDTVSDKPEKNEKKLDKAVAKMFLGLAPAAGK